MNNISVNDLLIIENGLRKIFELTSVRETSFNISIDNTGYLTIDDPENYICEHCDCKCGGCNCTDLKDDITNLNSEISSLEEDISIKDNKIESLEEQIEEMSETNE